MFPKQTKRTEKGFVSAVEGVEDAIDVEESPSEALIMGVILTGQLINLSFCEVWGKGHWERGRGEGK